MDVVGYLRQAHNARHVWPMELQVRIKVDTDAVDAAIARMRRTMARFMKANEARAAPVWRPWSWYRTSERSR